MRGLQLQQLQQSLPLQDRAAQPQQVLLFHHRLIPGAYSIVSRDRRMPTTTAQPDIMWFTLSHTKNHSLGTYLGIHISWPCLQLPGVAQTCMRGMSAPNLGAEGVAGGTSMSPDPRKRDHYSHQWPDLRDSDRKSKRDEVS